MYIAPAANTFEILRRYLQKELCTYLERVLVPIPIIRYGCFLFVVPILCLIMETDSICISIMLGWYKKIPKVFRNLNQFLK